MKTNKKKINRIRKQATWFNLYYLAFFSLNYIHLPVYSGAINKQIMKTENSGQVFTEGKFS